MVEKIADLPCLVKDKNICGLLAAPIASDAILKPPSVPFLKPIGQDTPEASSLCPWLSVVLAPIAPHEIRSATYCGEIKSKNSVPQGTP